MKTSNSILLLALTFVASPAHPAILLRDSFSYPDGALTNVASGIWRHTSGGAAEVNVTGGRLELTRSETEDVDASLGASFGTTSGAVLYSKFSVTVLALPGGVNGNYFAHVAGGSARARVFVTTNGAAPGQFRFGLANGSTTASAIWPQDLETNRTYTVLTCHAVSNAQASLWIDPIDDSSLSIAATDTASASTANAFAWRQDTGMGVLAVDDLVVATSFGEALSGNETPSISNIADQRGAENGVVTIPFAVGDAETDADTLDVFASWSNDSLVQGASFGGSGSNRTVTINLYAGQIGVSVIAVLVTDGTTTNSDTFVLTVVPALLYSDNFSYPDGPLITNATPPWSHHSGNTTGQVQVVNGRLALASTLSEDVNVALPGGPYSANSGVMLYAGFRLRFSQLPGSTGDYFAHFNTTGARCRLFANTANAGPRQFRLGIANAANAASEQFPSDLSTNTEYLVVLRYDPATATSTLWVDPASESDSGVTAGDAATASAIGAFSLRQDPGIGTLAIDDLRIGLTFASVVSAPQPPPPGLRITHVAVFWPSAATVAGFVLEWTPDLSSPEWQAIHPSGVEGDEHVLNFPDPLQNGFFRLRKIPAPAPAE